MKNKVIGKGNPCPKCAHDMLRWGHPLGWAPKRGQPYYFSYWDRCSRCRHMQHYEVAKVHLTPFGTPDVISSDPRQSSLSDPSRTIGKNFVPSEDDGSDPF